MKIIIGNILEATEEYIAHQSNCVSTGAAGLAYHLFKKFPYANVYETRTKVDQSLSSLRDKPGTITICGNGKDQKYIINLMGQLYPGGLDDNDQIDNEVARVRYFKSCLRKIAKHLIKNNAVSIAFPVGVGCGIAGGNWLNYLSYLQEFASSIEKHNINVSLYCLPEMMKTYNIVVDKE